MPPSKGRTLRQRQLGFKAVKLQRQNRDSKVKPSSILSGNKLSDEALLKLRIPLSLAKALPSVKKYSNASKKSRSRMLNSDVVDGDSDFKLSNAQSVQSSNRRRHGQQKYHLQLETEERFPGMPWDLIFLRTDHIVVGTSEGAFVCDADLTNMHKLDKIQQSGGMAVLSDGRFVIICKFADEAFIFEEDFSLSHSFKLGSSPTGVAVTADDELIVTDTIMCSVLRYDTQGKLLATIPPSGAQYAFKWPLYPAINEDHELLVSDSHCQLVFVFSKDGSYLREFPLKTFGGNFVLRPHGVATNGSDVFIIDRAIDSMEVFLGDGRYLQTLITSDEGAAFKPKVVRIDHTGSFLLLGGLSGYVRLYRFVDDPNVKTEPAIKIKQENGSKRGRHGRNSIKKEVGLEHDHLDNGVILPDVHIKQEFNTESPVKIKQELDADHPESETQQPQHDAQDMQTDNLQTESNGHEMDAEQLGIDADSQDTVSECDSQATEIDPNYQILDLEDEDMDPDSPLVEK